MIMKFLKTIFKPGIKMKLTVFIVPLIILTVGLITSLTYHRYSSDLVIQSKQKDQLLLEQVSLNIDTYLDEVFRLCRAPYYSRELMEVLEQPAYSDQDKLFKQRAVEGFLDEVMLVPRQDILRVFIISDSVYSSVKTSASIDMTEDITETDWYERAFKSYQPFLLPLSSTDASFSVVQGLHKISDSTQSIGVIKVDANYAGIKSICDLITIEADCALFITDSAGQVIYQNNKLATAAYASLLIEESVSSSDIWFDKTIEGHRYLVSTQKISTSDWRLVSVIAYSQVNQYARSARDTAVLLALLCAVAAVALTTLMIRRIMAPLSNIVDLMKIVQTGRLDVCFAVKSNDEIGFLGENFNQMVDRIHTMIETNTQLVKEVYEAKYLQKEAQYAALYNQIRPHFLFNTLNAISILIKTDKSADAVKAINKLAFLLRGMVNLEKDIRIADEIKIVEAYLMLQQMRWGDRLRYQIQITEPALLCRLPALSIQTLVENAIIHGAGSSRQTMEIEIYSESVNDSLFVHVIDNGQGISPEKLGQVNRSLSDDISGQPASDPQADQMAQDGKIGIGLRNVNRRLQLKFGSQYGLRIESEPGEGTHVILHAPGSKCTGEPEKELK